MSGRALNTIEHLGVRVRRGIVTLGIVATLTSTSLAAPVQASATSLNLVLGQRAGVGEPYAIAAEGDTNGASRLYVYVDAGGAACATDPSKEATEVSGVTPLSAVGGDVLASGAFTRLYSFTPPTRNGYSVCAYLYELPEGTPVLSARAGFAAPGGPVQAPYLFNPQLEEEMKRLAVEHQQREVQEQARLRKEKEERERIPASELAQPEQSPSVHVAAGPVVHCIVPSLKKHSLGAARSSLRHAHCTLGRVTRPRHYRGALVVTRQSAPRNTKLHDGAAVAVVLGPVRH